NHLTRGRLVWRHLCRGAAHEGERRPTLSKGKRRSSARKRTPILAAVSVAALILSFAVASVASGSGTKATLKFKPAGGLTAASTYSGAKSDSGYIAQSDPSLLGRTDSTRVNIMVKYDFDATASYDGGLAGLAATSPRVTGKPLSENQGAVQAYDAFTAN